MKRKNGRIEILIAEDSPTQSEQLQYLLEGHGFKVAAAANGRQALESLRQHKPSLLISDVVMPEMDGYELCQAIKSDESLRDIPVILVTTLSDVLDIMKGLECGADNFIRKPYEEKYLLARVDYLLMNHELRKSQKMQMGMEIHLGGQRHFITAERQQIVDMLISVYDEAVHLNEELKARQSDLLNSNRALNGLYHIAEGLNRAVSEREVCERALEHALELPGVRAGWISLREGESGFRLAAARNLPPALLEPGVMEGLCECRRRLLAGELDHVTNILECERLGKAKGDTQGLRYHASVPLWIGGQMLGVMNLVGADRGLFKEEELETLYSVGHQVGIALERAWLHEDLERLVEERTATLAAEVEERKRTQTELTQLNESLEQRVAERTADLERARSEADAANRAKSAFLATMSHEIRTPMNGVIGMVDVLAQSDLTVHQVDLVNTIRESAGSLLGIIDDILDFSKIEAGRLELEHEPVCVADLVEGLCNSLVPVANRKGVGLSLFVSPEVPERVLSDDVRLRQVLYNLVGNAIKFSAGRPERQGRVSIRVEVAQASPFSLAFRVADNGIGMAPDTVDHLFSPFSQAEVSTTRRFGGTGLGLTICKRLVDLMQGEIAVQSTLGEGSAFTVTLPFEAPEEQPVRALPDLSGLDCIVLKSPRIDADDLRVYLQHAGAQVRITDDVADAVRISAQSGSPVVLIRESANAKEPSPFATMANVRQLLITHGRRRRARVEFANTVTLDGDALRRQALLRAVAVATGRASPEIFQESPEKIRIGEGNPPPTIAEARAQGRLILVAEDDEINQKVILKQLALLGHAAEIAANGAEALRMWRKGRYALLLTDLHMPEMDGYTLAQTIRQEEAGRSHRPIIALTANALRGEANRAHAAGLDEYLTKPVKLPELRAMLEKWMPSPAGTAAQAAPRQKSRGSRTSVLNLSVLKNLVGDDPATVNEFLSDYLASSRDIAEEMRAAFAAGDPRQVGALAHKLKSSSRAVGALALGELCARLESLGEAGDLEAIAQGMARFDTALGKVEAEIARLLEK